MLACEPRRMHECMTCGFPAWADCAVLKHPNTLSHACAEIWAPCDPGSRGQLNVLYHARNRCAPSGRRHFWPFAGDCGSIVCMVAVLCDSGWLLSEPWGDDCLTLQPCGPTPFSCTSAGLVVVGTDIGEVCAHTARDNTAVGKDHPHASAVTAMDSGHVAATGAKLIASASRGHLVIHDLIIKTAELVPLAKVRQGEGVPLGGINSAGLGLKVDHGLLPPNQRGGMTRPKFTLEIEALDLTSLPLSPKQVDLPADADEPEHYPCSVSLSANSGHVAICYSSGALAVYVLDLPASYYAPATGRTTVAAAPGVSAAVPLQGGSGGGQLTLAVHMSVATVRGLLVGASQIGACRIEWQLQQRPDKSGRSDRFHKPARGVYMWWQGCSRLALSYLDAATSSSTGAAAASSSERSASPQKAAAGGGGAKPATPLAKGAAAAVPPAAESAAAASGGRVPHRRPYRGWLLPHGITCSCITYDGTMLAFGMADGSAVVWDDQFGEETMSLSPLWPPLCHHNCFIKVPSKGT